jgi:uncharacterized membrane protein
MSKYFQQTSIHNNAYAVLNNLFLQLQILFTNAYLSTELQNHPAYPSLQALQAVLNEYQVDNLAIQIGIEQINELELPAIAHLHTQGGYFVLLQAIDNQSVTYLDPAQGKIQLPIAEFAQQWSGVVLMAIANEQSGEPNYAENRQAEQNQKIANYLIYSSLAGLLVLSLLSASNVRIFLALLSSWLGLGLSILLLMSSLGSSYTWVQQVCHLTQKSSCDTVLQSKGARLFSWLSWAEVGLVYFSGVVLSIFWANVSPHSSPIFSILAVLSVLALPYSVFSVYYQALMLRVWCPLCIAVQVILWVNFACLVGFLALTNLYLIDYQVLIIFMGSFLTSILFWFTLKPQLYQAIQVKPLEKRLAHFRRNNDLFWAYFEKTPPIDTKHLRDVILGNSEAPVKILLVSNPLCAPCAVAHQTLTKLQSQFSEDICLQIRLLPDKKPDTEKNQVIRHLLSLPTATQADEALQDWYNIRNYAKWAKKYPVSQLIDNEVFMDNTHWATMVGIEITPTIFINGRIVQSPYTINDLKYQLRNIIETNLIHSND